MTILIAPEVQEIFSELPVRAKLKAMRSLDFLVIFPNLYPVRRRGLMKGFRYFFADSYLFYYQVRGDELRVTAVIPGVMRGA